MAMATATAVGVPNGGCGVTNDGGNEEARPDRCDGMATELPRALVLADGAGVSGVGSDISSCRKATLPTGPPLPLPGLPPRSRGTGEAATRVDSRLPALSLWISLALTSGESGCMKEPLEPVAAGCQEILVEPASLPELPGDCPRNGDLELSLV